MLPAARRSAARSAPPGWSGDARTGRAVRSTASTSRSEACAGNASSAACSVPVAAGQPGGQAEQPVAVDHAGVRAAPRPPAPVSPCGTTTASAAGQRARPRSSATPQLSASRPPRRQRSASSARRPATSATRRRRNGRGAAQAALRKMTEALVPPKPKLLDSATSICRCCAVLRHPVDHAVAARVRRGSASAAPRRRGSPGWRRSPRPRPPRPAGGRSPTWWTTSPGPCAASPNSRSTASSSRSSPSGVEVPWALTYWISAGANAAVLHRRPHGAERAVMALGRRGDVVGVAGHAVAGRPRRRSSRRAAWRARTPPAPRRRRPRPSRSRRGPCPRAARPRVGRSLNAVDSAREAQKPAMPSSQTAASAPPATITSASPHMISRAASPIACTPVAQAVTTEWFGPLKPYLIETMAGAEVDQRRGDEERRQPPRLALVHQHRRLVDGLQPADAGADHHAGGAAVLLGLGQPAGILHRLGRRRPWRDG